MKLISIQILRGLAALSVVIFHIRAIETQSILQGPFALDPNQAVEPSLVSGLWKNGFMGVDLFFVISGFIMVYVTRDLAPGGRSVRSFLFARITRIYPVWWLFASIMVIYFLITYGAPVDMGRVEATGESVWHYLFKSYFLVPLSEPPVLGVGWTLIHEMYFYLGFAILLLLPKKWLVPGLLVWAIGSASGALLGLSRPSAGDYPSLIVHPMTLEFLAGALAACLIKANIVVRPALLFIASSVWLAASMQLVLAPEIGLGDWNAFMLQWGRVLFYGLPCTVLVYAMAGLEARDQMRWLLAGFGAAIGFVLGDILTQAVQMPSRIAAGFVGAAICGAVLGTIGLRQARLTGLVQTSMGALGNWSYALYLSHVIVLSGWRQVLPKVADLGERSLSLSSGQLDVLRLGRAGLVDNLLFLVLCLVSSIIVSWLAYRLFEQPLMSWFRSMRIRLFAS